MNKPIWAESRLYHAGSEATPQTGTALPLRCGSNGGGYFGPRYNFGNIHEIKSFWQAIKPGTSAP
ncbi:hypothetical protein [Pseudomonas fluorescens]|uniref:hypothetical protein n=1 Tax=Pseudomonas fluorescens TaxID=294 RepID=UPI00177F49ED|nr:hypothetical protein [Pseudomonas fluorescens]